MKKSLFAAACLASTLGFSQMANAEILKFTLTGDVNAFWFLDSNPATAYAAGTSETFASDVNWFAIGDAQGSFPGATYNYVADIAFYNAVYDGGLEIVDNYAPGGNVALLTLFGDQLYTGPETAPVFSASATPYTLYDANDPTRQFSLSITGAAVPEPSTWAMMIIGFGAVGGAMRARRSGNVRVTFGKASKVAA